jgi:hypothetical protein
MLLPVVDPKYRAKVLQAMMDGMMVASLDADMDTLAWLPGDVVDAAAEIIALMAVASKVVDSDVRARAFSEDVARRVRAAIAEFQEDALAGRMDFVTVIQRGKEH